MEISRCHRPAGHWDWPIPLPYSMGVKLDGLVMVGGQVALDEEGRVLHPGDIAAQARICMDYLGRVLTSLGAAFQDVIKVNTFYVGHGTQEDWEEAARIRAEYFPEPGPIATGIPVPALAYEGLMIEIEAVAVNGGAACQ